MVESKIKIRPQWWLKIPFKPFNDRGICVAFFPNIYLPEYVYNNLYSDSPDPGYQALLVHENEHYLRQREVGWYKWLFKYLTDRKYRFSEELAADKAEMRFLKKIGGHFDLNIEAQLLSGSLYHHPVSFEYAKQELEKAWKEI